LAYPSQSIFFINVFEQQAAAQTLTTTVILQIQIAEHKYRVLFYKLYLIDFIKNNFGK